MRLIRIRYGAQEQFLAFVFRRIFDLGPSLDIQEGPPWLRMVGKTLHEGSIAVFAGMQATHVRVHGIIRYRKVGFGEDGLDVYFFDGHNDYSLLDLRY